MTDVRRPEEARRVRGDQELLVPRRRRAPDAEDAVLVMVVEQHEEARLLRTKKLGAPWLGRSLVAGSARQIVPQRLRTALRSLSLG